MLKKFSGSSTPTTSNTAPPLDELLLNQLLERLESALDLQKSLSVYIHTLGKLREGSNGQKVLISQLLGGSLKLSRSDATKRLGTANEAIGNYTESYLISLEEIVKAIGNRVIELQDFSRTHKEAEKRRATLEAIILKISKKSTTKAELEDELTNATTAYEDNCYLIQRKATALEEGVSREDEETDMLLNLQLDYANKCAKTLSDCKSSSRQQSNGLTVPGPTRMNRAHSESSVAPPDFSNTIKSTFSRARSSTVSSGRSTPTIVVVDQLKNSESTKTRSRSGSLLSRFVSKKEETTDDDGKPQPSPTSNGFSLPSLPTLNSFKKLASTTIPGPSKYTSLLSDNPDPPIMVGYSTPHPRLLRSQTSPTPRSPSPPPRNATPKVSNGDKFNSTPKPLNRPPSIGDTFEVKYAFKATDVGEIDIERGTIIVLEKVINSDWYIGKIQSASNSNEIGKSGMFPSAFVEAYEVPSTRERSRTLLSNDLMRSASIKSVQSIGANSIDSNWDEGGMSSSASVTDQSDEGDEHYSLQPHNSSEFNDNYEGDNDEDMMKPVLMPTISPAKRAPPPPPPSRK